MVGVNDLCSYAVGAALITLLPGPNSMYILSLAAQRGVRAGYLGACGILLGDTTLMALSAAGVSATLHAHSAVFTVGKYAGAGYLAYVGFTMMRGAWRQSLGAGPPTAGAHRVRLGRHRPTTVPDPQSTPSRDAQRPFRRALLISLLNPKMILFFLSYFAQFVDPRYPHPGLSFMLLGGVIQLFSALYLTTLILAGSYLAGQFRQRRRLAAGMIFLAGAIFVGFGMRLVTAPLG